MQRLPTVLSKRSEQPLKKYWSLDMLENLLKMEPETLEEDPNGPHLWLPLHERILNVALYLVLGLLFTILYVILYLPLVLIWCVILQIQQLREAPN